MVILFLRNSKDHENIGDVSDTALSNQEIFKGDELDLQRKVLFCASFFSWMTIKFYLPPAKLNISQIWDNKQSISFPRQTYKVKYLMGILNQAIRNSQTICQIFFRKEGWFRGASKTSSGLKLPSTQEFSVGEVRLSFCFMASIAL